MKNILFIIMVLPILGFSQIPEVTIENVVPMPSEDRGDWFAGLYEIGMTVTEDSVILSKEFQKVLQDENYRSILYPEVYTWHQALKFMEANELKKAFWFFINLYSADDLSKEMVIKSILLYDQLLKMDEVLIATFYTYSFMDPEVSILKNGKPEIVRPDLLEAKLRSVKEIVGYIYTFRDKNSQ